jgi:hypothetical protein
MHPHISLFFYLVKTIAEKSVHLALNLKDLKRFQREQNEILSFANKNKKTTSVVSARKANYTDRATAVCRRS